MGIDYKLAIGEINNAMKRATNYATGGLDSLLAGRNYNRQPAPVFARANREQYRPGVELPSIDSYLNDSRSPKHVPIIPTAREMLYRLLNFF